LLLHSDEGSIDLKTAIVFLCFFFFAASLPGKACADPWKEIRAAAEKITSVRGEFTQTRHMKILARPLLSKGTFLFRAPDSIRWEYRTPFRSILLAHNGTAKRFVQKNDELVVDSSAGLQSMQMVVQEIGLWLKGRFDENPAFTASLESGKRIVLLPKEQAIAALIQRIEIVLSGQDGVIESVTILEGKDSFTRIEFDQVTLNRPMEDALFQDP